MCSCANVNIQELVAIVYKLNEKPEQQSELTTKQNGPNSVSVFYLTFLVVFSIFFFFFSSRRFSLSFKFCTNL